MRSKREWLSLIYCGFAASRRKEFSSRLKLQDSSQKIDCIHLFEDQDYRIFSPDRYYSSCHTIGTCKICGLRVLRRAYGDFTHIPEKVHQLIGDVWKEVHGEQEVRWGSGFYSELPLQVARIMDNNGESEAREYVRQILKQGSIPNY